MTPSEDNLSATSLRRLAEERARKIPVDASALSPEEMQKTLHELQVHQIELEMQNEELRRIQIQMDEARTRYFDLYDLAPVGYCALSETGQILEANLTAASLLGVTRSRLVNRHIFRFIFEEDQNIYFQCRSQLIKTGKPQARELRMLKPDGTTFWAHLDATAAQDANGKPVLRVTLSDTSEYKTAEAALRQSESHLNKAQRFARLGNWTWHIPTNHLEWSDEMYIIFGVDKKTFSGSLPDVIAQSIHPDDRAKVDAANRSVANEGKPVPLEYRVVWGDGSIHIVWAEAGEMLFGLDGRPVSLSGTVQDITERKQAENALQESEERYRRLVENAPDIVYTFSNQRGGIYYSPRVEQVLGYSAEHLYAHPMLWNESIHPEDRPRISAIIGDFEVGKSFNIEYRIQDAQGNWHWLQDRSIGREVGNGEVLVEGLATDITARKQADDLLIQTRQNYETFFNTIDEFLFVLNEQGNIIHINATVINRLGYTSEELFGKSVLMIHPPERRDEAGRIVGEMLSGVTEFCPVPIITKSGVQIPVETRVSHGFWDGKPVIFGVTKDISKVRLSEEKFSKVFHLNPSACGLSDANDRKYVEVNEAFYTLLGFDKDEVIGKTAFDLGILTKETANAILLKTDSNGIVTNAETDIRAKNGDIKHVLLSAENINVQDKKYRYTVVHDITARKQAEESLRNAYWRTESIIEGTQVGTWEWNVQTGETAFNEKWAQIIGYTLAELAPISIKTWEKFAHPDDLKQSDELLERHFAGELPNYDYESRMKHKDGHWVWVLDRGRVLTRSSDGKPLMMFGTHQDITERKLAEDDLAAKTHTLESVFESAPYIMMLVNMEGRVTDINRIGVQFANRDKDELLGLLGGEVFGCLNSFHGPGCGKNKICLSCPVRSRFTHTFETGEPIYEGEGQLEIIKDGSRINLDILVSTALVQTTDDRHVLVTIADITGRKQTENALQKSEERYRSLFDNMTEGFALHELIFDENGVPYDYRFLDINRAFENLTGLKRESIIGKGQREALPEEDEFWFKTYCKVALTGESVYLDNYSPSLQRHYEVYAYSPAPNQFAVVFMDVTARKQAETALRESEQRYRAVAHSASDAIISANDVGNIVGWNPSAEKLFGYTESEISGQPLNLLVPIRYHHTHSVSMERLQIGGERRIIGKTIEVEGRRRDGSEFPLELSLAEWQVTAGRFYTAIIRDITARKRDEQQIKTALAEKEILLRELYHRTKNNMQVICAMLELQSDNVTDELALRVFRETENKIRSMALIHQMLYQSQNLSSIDLKEYITDLATLLMKSYKIHPGRIALILNLESVPVLIDTATPCGLILNELISNAFKYAFPGERKGKISLSLAKTADGFITLQFSDDGVGLPPGFDFRHTDTLGLQTVLALAERQLQGKVTFTQAGGLTCQIRFQDTLYEARV